MFIQNNEVNGYIKIKWNLPIILFTLLSFHLFPRHFKCIEKYREYEKVLNPTIPYINIYEFIE